MAIWAKNGKVGYVNKLENYDAGELAKVATNQGSIDNLQEI
jgi:hypothetical protein